MNSNTLLNEEEDDDDNDDADADSHGNCEYSSSCCVQLMSQSVCSPVIL